VPAHGPAFPGTHCTYPRRDGQAKLSGPCYRFSRTSARIFAYTLSLYCQQEILLDCDQANVHLARIIFSSIFLSAFSFLLACIRDPAST